MKHESDFVTKHNIYPPSTRTEKLASKEDKDLGFNLVNYAIDFYKEVRAQYGGTQKLFE